MAPSRKTWIWIIVGVVGFVILCIIGLAGFGMYFISNHVSARAVTSAEAFKVFDNAREPFKSDKPVFDLDNLEHVRQLRQFSEMPTSTTKTDSVWVLAWDPDKGRLVKVSLPFWVLRLGRQKIDISSGAFDLQRLQLDIKELGRVGPQLLFDFRTPSGDRVLIWTK